MNGLGATLAFDKEAVCVGFLTYSLSIPILGERTAFLQKFGLLPGTGRIQSLQLQRLHSKLKLSGPDFTQLTRLESTFARYA